VTRTNGLRQKVEELLSKGYIPPDNPDNFEASVALELPVSEETEASLIEEISPNPSPETPPSADATVALEMPILSSDEALPDVPTKSPLQPLTPEERGFYKQQKEIRDTLNGMDEYALFRDYVELRFEEMGGSATDVEFETIIKKKERYDSLFHPKSFDEWFAIIASANEIYDEDGTLLELSPEEYIQKIEDFRLGLNVWLPDFIRAGAERMISVDIEELIKNKGALHIAKHEWEIFEKLHPTVSAGGATEAERELFNVFTNSAGEVFTKEGKIEGRLVWAEHTGLAVFETNHSDEYLVIDSRDILVASEDKTIGELYDNEMNRSRGFYQQQQQQQRARDLPR
jgi:hypothetical protein